jgi:hypothetical protein
MGQKSPQCIIGLGGGEAGSDEGVTIRIPKTRNKKRRKKKGRKRSKDAPDRPKRQKEATEWRQFGCSGVTDGVR